MRNISLLTIIGSGLLLSAFGCSDDEGSEESGDNSAGNVMVGAPMTPAPTTPTTPGDSTPSGSTPGGGSDDTVDSTGNYLGPEATGVTGTGVSSYADMGGSTILATSPESGKVCFAGTAAKVENGEWGTYWGAGADISLALPGETWDGSASSSFTFTLEGSTIPASLEVGVADDTSELDNGESLSFWKKPAEGENTFAFDDLTPPAWTELTDNRVDKTTIRALIVQVSTNESAAVPFDFCLSNISIDGYVAPEPAMGGAPAE
ncbi:MAG: hypothetical protein MK135_02655 [Polyangiaceae bacterium]|nr:hypothetical protein [Polyangiaceae bacterium]